MPELRHLRAFAAVGEELNFTRAAERLHASQQSVSKTVAQLERELGVPLLERTSREVRLTAAGASLLGDAREIVTAADAALARAVTVGRGLGGTVYVGVSPSITVPERHRVAAELRDGAPDLSVSFHEVRPADYVDALRERTVDVVLTRTFAGSADVDSAPLTPTPVELVAAAGHRLAVDRPVHLSELGGERLMLWSRPGTPYTDLILSRLRAAGAEVMPVESKITGGGGSPELAAERAVTIVPRGAFAGADVARMEIADEFTVPLLLLWPMGLPHAAVTRLREGLSRPAA